MNITTTSRFKQFAGITGSSQDALITALITETSGQIERYLRRTLTATTYKAWYDGTGGPELRLLQYPITAIYQVSVTNSSVAYVTNNNSSAVATLSFDGTSLTLASIAADGTETLATLAVATYKSLSALQTAINALTGWTCTLQNQAAGNLPATFLRPIYGQDALSPGQADLIMPDSPSAVKIISEDMIEIINSEQFPQWDIFPNAQLPNRMSALQPSLTPPTFSYGFPPGSKNVFVWFKAGYDLPTDSVDGTLPAGLLLTAHQIIWDVLGSTKLNSNMSSERIGDYSYNLRESLPGAVGSAITNRRRDLNQYRRVSI